MANFLNNLSNGNILSWAVFVVISIFLLACVSFVSFRVGLKIQKRKSESLVEKERSDAVKRSRAVIAGQVSEQIAPFLPNFPCDPGDARFVGKPLDFVAFPGAAGGGAIEEILFIEVKTGSSRLSQREKEIKVAVENGRVRYIVYRI